jgi:glycyl-tRNA synthetase (class II)
MKKNLFKPVSKTTARALPHDRQEDAHYNKRNIDITSHKDIGTTADITGTKGRTEEHINTTGE